MSNLAVHTYPHVYRDTHPDCVPGCGYPYWVSDVHPVHCVQWSSRGLICHVLRDDGQSDELELGVVSASATRDPHGEVDYTLPRHHRNIVQLRTMLPDGSEVELDFSRGDARCLAAALTVAADTADGLVTR